MIGDYEALIPIRVKESDGIITQEADVMPVDIVCASVIHGTVLVELSNDLFSLDVRPVIYITTAAQSVEVFAWAKVLKGERIRITVNGTPVEAFVRINGPTKNIP